MPSNLNISFNDGDLIEADHVKQFADPVNDLESGRAFFAGASSGSATAYEVALSPPPESPINDGMILNFKAIEACGASPTLSINGGTAYPLVKNGGTALAANDIQANQIVSVVFEGGSFHLVASASSGGAYLPLTGGTLTGDLDATGQVISSNILRANELRGDPVGGFVLRQEDDNGAFPCIVSFHSGWNQGSDGAAIQLFGNDYPNYPGGGYISMILGPNPNAELLLGKSGESSHFASFRSEVSVIRGDLYLSEAGKTVTVDGNLQVAGQVSGNLTLNGDLAFAEGSYGSVKSGPGQPLGLELNPNGDGDYLGFVRLYSGPDAATIDLYGTDWPHYPSPGCISMSTPPSSSIRLYALGDTAPYAWFQKNQINLKNRLLIEDNVASISLPQDEDEEFKGIVTIQAGWTGADSPALELLGKDYPGFGGRAMLSLPGTTGMFQVGYNGGADMIADFRHNSINFKNRFVLEDNLFSIAFPMDAEEEFKGQVAIRAGWDSTSGAVMELYGKDNPYYPNGVSFLWPGTSGFFQIAENGGVDVLARFDSNGCTLKGLSGTVQDNLAACPRKYAATIGDGTTTDITVSHNLGSRDVVCSVYKNGTPYDQRQVDIEHTDANTLTLRFTTAPASDELRVVVIG